MENKTIGIKDIAQHAGVSTGPVDKVLNNRGGVSKATRERILQAIKELNYTPNILASRLKSAKQYKIAVLIPEATKEIPYWSEQQRGFADAMKQLTPYGFSIHVYYFHQNNECSFTSHIPTILSESYDGVFMVPVFNNETVKFVNQLKRKKIPVIFFDTQVAELPNIPFIGQHSADSGYLAGELLHKCLPTSSSVLIISLINTHDNHLQFNSREAGFRDYFRDTGVNIIKYENSLDDANCTNAEISELIKNETNIGGVFVTNGIHSVAPVFTKKNECTLIGYDLIEENIKYLKKGVIDFLISQRPYTQAHSGIQLFYDLLILKKSLNKRIYLPIEIVMKSNLKYYNDLLV